MSSSRAITCNELVPMVTAYLERALVPADLERFENHLRTCSRCGTSVAQWEAMVRSLGRLENTAEGTGSPEKERLVALFREHGFHQPGRRTPRIPLGLNSELAAPGDHLVYLWETEQEFQALAGFIALGAAQGETCVLIGYEKAGGRLESAMNRAGVDATALQRQARLSFIPGMKSADRLFEVIAELIASAVDRGAPLIRILGNPRWGRPDWPGDRELQQLEARITDAVLKLPVVVMCAYDVRSVSNRNLLLGGLHCHPLKFHRQALRQNEQFIPSETFLATQQPEEL